MWAYSGGPITPVTSSRENYARCNRYGLLAFLVERRVDHEWTRQPIKLCPVMDGVKMRNVAVEEVSKIQAAQVQATLAGLGGGAFHQPAGSSSSSHYNYSDCCSSSSVFRGGCHGPSVGVRSSSRVMPMPTLYDVDRDPLLRDPEWRLKHRPLTHQTLRDALRSVCSFVAWVVQCMRD